MILKRHRSYCLVELIERIFPGLDRASLGALGSGSGGSNMNSDGAVVTGVSGSGGLQGGGHFRRSRDLSVLGVVVLVEEGRQAEVVVVVTARTGTGRSRRGGSGTTVRVRSGCRSSRCLSRRRSSRSGARTAVPVVLEVLVLVQELVKGVMVAVVTSSTSSCRDGCGGRGSFVRDGRGGSRSSRSRRGTVVVLLVFLLLLSEQFLRLLGSLFPFLGFLLFLLLVLLFGFLLLGLLSFPLLFGTGGWLRHKG